MDAETSKRVEKMKEYAETGVRITICGHVFFLPKHIWYNHEAYMRALRYEAD